jgi:hypothetical protein
MAGFLPTAHAWDFPLEITPVAMKFYHGYSGGALDIRINANTNVTVPEYYPSRNDPCAYKISSTPKVLVMFWTDSADTPSITIDAIASGDTSWELADKTMLFNPGSGYSNTDSVYTSETNYQMFNTASGFPGTVGKRTYSWIWRVVAVNGTPRTPETVGTTSDHTLYTVLDTPQSPMSEPWTEVLDWSCFWASDKTSVQTCVDSLTTKIFTCGAIYNSEATDYVDENDKLKLGGSSGILYKLNNQLSLVMDCRAFSHFFNVLASSLGITSFYEELSMDEGEIETREILVAGDPSSMWPGIGNWEDNTFSFAKHQISTVTINGEKIVDTALLLYNTQYLTSPVEFQFQSGVNPFENNYHELESYAYLLGEYYADQLNKTSDQKTTELQ